MPQLQSIGNALCAIAAHRLPVPPFSRETAKHLRHIDADIRRILNWPALLPRADAALPSLRKEAVKNQHLKQVFGAV